MRGVGRISCLVGVALLLAACSSGPAVPPPPAVEPSALPIGPSPITQVAFTTQPSISTGFVPMSFSAVKPSHWWVLGYVECGRIQCPALASSADRGATEISLPVPGTPFGPGVAQPPEVGTIDFANARDGWAWGPNLFATQDGGRHWTQISTTTPVTALVVGGDRVYAIWSSLLWEASISGNHWVRVAKAPDVGGGLASRGSSLWVTSAPYLDTSTNSGGSFTALAPLVLGGDCTNDAVSASVLWSYCDDGGHQFLYRSADSGAQVQLAGHSVLGEPDSPDGSPPGSTFAAASSSTVVVASSVAGSPLTQSSDGGVSFHVAQRAPDKSGTWSVIGFTTSAVGYAFWQHVGIAYGNNTVQLWRTTDGGTRWKPVPAHYLTN